jgi:error-prone DNA polymerase
MTSYAELQVTTNYSFLRGASHPEELFAQAKALGHSALGAVDRNTLAGIVRCHEAARDSGVRLVVGCRIDLSDAPPLLLYPTSRDAYARLCALLSVGKGRGGKSKCILSWSDVVEHGNGLLAMLIPDKTDEDLARWLRRLRGEFGDRSYVALTPRHRPRDALRLEALSRMAAAECVGSVATNDVLYHIEERRLLQDVLTCAREKTTIDALGFRRERFADRHLKSPEEMASLFRRHPEAIERTREVVERARFSMDELQYQYPEEACIPGLTPQEALESLAWEGASKRYPHGIPDKVAVQLRHELATIGRMKYAPYFLTVHSIVAFARSKDILCQGRGSAANSVVCYCLGITAIDPERQKLLFERFVSEERGEPPDIDIDFEHDRREIVIQWVYDTYGRDRAALASTVVRYRARGAMTDVGKALGFPRDLILKLTKSVWAWSSAGISKRHAAQLNLNLDDHRVQMALRLAEGLIGFPRHLSQHPGGFVLTRDRLDSLVPIEPARMTGRQVVEWDKDDLDAMHMMKVDCLGLGMLGCLRRSFDLLREHKGIKVDLISVPPEDPAVYDMLCEADTIGTFQVESRAQQQMLPRLEPRDFEDLKIEIAIVRPGPIQGEMVHPFIQRRKGLEQYVPPTPEFDAILGRTLGIPLFQEQAMALAIDCAGFTPGQADQLRRSMATFKFTGGVSKFRQQFIEGMIARNYDRHFAERCFRMIEGFGSYGFPESHSASFAIIAYCSAWVKRYHPDTFLASLLNSLPMGFYPAVDLVEDAIRHGVEVRPVDINHSHWDCTLEPTGKELLAVRLGMRMVEGLRNEDAARIVTARGSDPYHSVEDVWRRARVQAAPLKRLADADAFGSISSNRRQTDWAVLALRDEPLPLFAAADAREGGLAPEIEETPLALPAMRLGQEVVADYCSLGLSLRAHPVAFLRADLAARGMISTADLNEAPNGSWVTTAGLVAVRQTPESANGVLFMTLKDETGYGQVIVWPNLFERQERLIRAAEMIACRGRVQREGKVVHLIAHHLTDLTELLRQVGERDEVFPVPLGRGDEVRTGGGPTQRHPRPAGKSREFAPAPASADAVIKVETRDFR